MINIPLYNRGLISRNFKHIAKVKSAVRARDNYSFLCSRLAEVEGNQTGRCYETKRFINIDKAIDELSSSVEKAGKTLSKALYTLHVTIYNEEQNNQK